MTFDELGELIMNPRPHWMEPKPCAVCRAEFVPADPRQECCPTHQRELINAIRRSVLRS